jgi:hypothetical protein
MRPAVSNVGGENAGSATTTSLPVKESALAARGDEASLLEAFGLAKNGHNVHGKQPVKH